MPEKFRTVPQLVRMVEQFRESTLPKQVLFTNGCFDLLHPGHVFLLNECRQELDKVDPEGKIIVAINTDDSVRRIKGPTRPIYRQGDRLMMLAALETVDYITVFSDETPLNLILALKPDYLVKGVGDEETVVGEENMPSWDGKTLKIDKLFGYSTTKLITRLQTDGLVYGTESREQSLEDALRWALEAGKFHNIFFKFRGRTDGKLECLSCHSAADKAEDVKHLHSCKYHTYSSLLKK
jgi:rfaE bifunctional protein nucleotidyltransferase chain/domain